ncbi:histidine kinase, partial [Leucobacter chromiiresistens]|uniref:histidine kinase n=1 Tax=Leucobacter chromiiresistens TaxID=1079994 RepID=UPI0009E6AC2F
VLIGALLLPLTLRTASAAAQLSRARVRAWGADLPAAHYAPPSPGLRGQLLVLAEPRRWADLAFETLIAFPLRTVNAVLAIAWTAVALGGTTYPAWGVFLPPPEQSLPGLVLDAWTGAEPGTFARSFPVEAVCNFAAGVVFLLLLPAVLRGLARLDVLVTTAALGQEAPSGVAPAPAGARGVPGGEPAAGLAGASAGGSARASSSGLAAGRTVSWSAENWAWIAAGFAAVVALAVGWPVLAVLYGVHVVIAMLIAAAQALALVLVVRWAAVGIAVQTAAAVATVLVSASTHAAWPWPWPVMALLVQAVLVLIVALRRHWLWAAAAWAGPHAAVALAAFAVGVDGAAGASLIVSASVSAAVLVGGVLGRQWLANRGALREERRTSAGLSAQRRELEERNRIARELHDVVAHSMSVISVQATTAKYRFPELGDDAEREFASIAGSSRQALAEMRGLLTLLRSADEDGGAPLAPQPTIAEIPALVAATRRSGLRIALVVEGVPDATALAPAVGLTAYRVVQESLSNAMRHAPGAEVSVSVRAAAGALEIDVENGAATTSGQHAAPGSGLGLAGVRERVEALGGSVAFGPTAEGFAVRARLPLG